MFRKAFNGVMFIKRFGIARFVVALVYRTTNWLGDSIFGVSTAGNIPLSHFGYSSDELLPYIPISYYELFKALRMLPIDRPSCSFLDYGSGKGRALVSASAMSFGRVTGIELCRELYDESLVNIANMRFKRSKAVGVHNVNAVLYEIPTDVNVIYFFNPFRGETLARVVDNIVRSYSSSPRVIHIIFFNNGDFDEIVRDNPLIVKTWEKVFHSHVWGALYVMGGPAMVSPEPKT